jgi:hypothetical protein
VGVLEFVFSLGIWIGILGEGSEYSSKSSELGCYQIFVVTGKMPNWAGDCDFRCKGMILFVDSLLWNAITSNAMTRASIA